MGPLLRRNSGPCRTRYHTGLVSHVQGHRTYTTEHEALGAKEGLVKFQPFIEGEHILLITDHAALQWARTYENANQRLAAWGAVFLAYSPKLEIIHCPGHVHSNVDPLSRLPRPPPPNFSLVESTAKTLRPNNTLAEFQEQAAVSTLAKRAFVITSITDCLEDTFATRMCLQSKQCNTSSTSKPETLQKAQPSANTQRSRLRSAQQSDTIPMNLWRDSTMHNQGRGVTASTQTKDTYDKQCEWEASHPPLTLHVSIHPDYAKAIVKGYKMDPLFKHKWEDETSDLHSWYALLQGPRRVTLLSRCQFYAVIMHP